MKNITFVLPQYPLHISGGYKMAFEYANRLANDNFNVTIIFLNDNAPHFLKIPSFFKKHIMNILTKRKIRWYPIDTKVKILSSTQSKAQKIIKDTDVVVATAAITVDPVLNDFKGTKKIYLIQDFEKWDMSPKELFRTYNAGFKNIVISKWLKEIVEQHSKNPPIYIKNPVDTDIYHVNIPITQRNRYTVGMLYHKAPHKGVKYALSAVSEVKKMYPNLKLIMFGSTRPPKDLPDWVTYYKNTSQRETVEIYNKISIFVCGSINEGFGLTGLESMACGDALVSTNYLGVREYAVDKENALLTPIKDSEKLAKNISYLISHDKERIKIARRAVTMAQSFSWDEAYSKFKKVIIGE